MARQGREMETGMSPRRCSLCSGRTGWSRSRDASADRVRTWWPGGVRPRKAWLRRGIGLPLEWSPRDYCDERWCTEVCCGVVVWQDGVGLADSSAGRGDPGCGRGASGVNEERGA